MIQEEKEIMRGIAQALEVLPEAKRERFAGYAEGVADMKEVLDREREKMMAMLAEQAVQPA